MTDQTERLGIIIKAIANNPGIKLSALCAYLKDAGVKGCEKTITSDIELLKNELRLLPNRPRLREGYFLLDIQTIGADETTVIFDALSAFGVNLNDARALKISRRLAVQVSPGVRSTGLRQRNIYKSLEEIDEALFLAIRNTQAVRLRLETPRASAPVSFVVYPLFRMFHERGWYLITRDVGKQSYFPCRIDRIKTCEILKRERTNDNIDADISQAQYLMNCGWGMDFPHTLKELEETETQPEIIVRFDRSISHFIREGVNRHPKALIKDSPDGSGCTDFHIKLRYHNEFKHWVRSWGSKAWFISPQSFVDEECAETRRKMMTYGIALD